MKSAARRRRRGQDPKVDVPVQLITEDSFYITDESGNQLLKD